MIAYVHSTCNAKISLCSHPFPDCLHLKADNNESFFTPKVLMQKLTGYPSSLYWYVKLGGGISGLAVAIHFPKVAKSARMV